jgi:hypothetical protein
LTSELDTLSKYIEENLKSGFICKSTSPVGSLILFVKKDGSLHLCVDYRAHNSVTMKNKYTLPLVTDTLDRLSNAKYFTKIDLRNGYHHVRIAEGEEWKTAFRTRYGHFKYQVMPFGLTNAPATFQCLINDTFHEYLDKFIVVYLDNILIYSNNLADHRKHVRLALEKMRNAQLFSKAEKCSYDASEVEYLGYIVGPAGISMDPAKLESLRSWPTPQSVKEAQSFLGFANFYRHFIEGFSKLAAPLTHLTRKDVPFKMGDDALKAFEDLKSAFVTAKILRHYRPRVQCVVESDVSGFALGAAISQKLDGKLHPIAFFSRKLTDPELNYEIHDKELLAIVEAFKHWCAYLEGVNESTLVYTNHKNLQYFFGTKVLNRRQACWYELLAGHNFVLMHHPGKQQGRSDALSWRPDYKEGSRPQTVSPSPSSNTPESSVPSHSMLSLL